MAVNEKMSGAETGDWGDLLEGGEEVRCFSGAKIRLSPIVCQK